MLLHQLIAIIAMKKSEYLKTISDFFKKNANTSLTEGFVRTYESLDIDGMELPPESKFVENNVRDAMNEFKIKTKSLFSAVASIEKSNQSAMADIVIENRTLMESVPVNYLVFLEEKMNELRTLIQSLPVLDGNIDWSFDTSRNMYKSVPKKAYKMKKIRKPFVLHEPTSEHPAQVELLYEEIPVGEFETVRYSGAIPLPVKKNWSNKIALLQEAVKIAIEKANTNTVASMDIDNFVDFIFSDITVPV